MTAKVRVQIDNASLNEQVEIVHFLDDRRHTIGAKRNWLLDRARGQFVVFIDDDDDVNDRYVSLICRTLKEHPCIDCVGIKGTIASEEGRNGRSFIPFSIDRIAAKVTCTCALPIT